MTDSLTRAEERILDCLKARGKVSQTRLASDLDLTKRHVRRAVNGLQNKGHSITKEMGDGPARRRVYALEEEERYPLNPGVRLTERQTLALVIALEAARPTLQATPFERDIAETLQLLLTDAEGILTFEPGQVRQQFHFQGAPSADIDPEIFKTIRRAIVDQARVSIDYFTASRQSWSRGRKIDPLGLSCVNGGWLCAAWCHRAGNYRDFNLVDIAVCERVGTAFDRPSGFDARDHFGGRFGALAGDDRQTVRLRLSSNAVAYFRRKQYHPTQQLGEVAEDGTATVTFQVSELRSVAAFVRSWGPKLEVLEPAALRETLRADAEALAALYAPPR